MLADTNHPPPSVGEIYSSAVGSGSTKVGADSTIRTPGDIIAAAGMNKHRTGLALRRLMTQWTAARKTITPPTPERIERRAAGLRVEPAMLPAANGKRNQVPNPLAGLVCDYIQGKKECRLPIVVAEQLVRHEYHQELTLAFLTMKELPSLRAALNQRTGDAHMVAAVLEWFLNPVCPECDGRKERTAHGTGRLSGRLCKPCRGTGERDAPHGWKGQRLASYLKECLSQSARDLREGFNNERRSAANKAERERSE